MGLKMDDMPDGKPSVTPEPPPVRWWKRLLRLLVALLIIAVGVAGANYLTKSAPKTRKRPPVKWIPMVQVATLQPTRHQVVVTAMGTVIPARQIVLKSRVSGQVLSINPEFTEGGFLKKGEKVIQLDDADYKLALAQRKSDLVNSQYALKLEQGQQVVARREWQLLSGSRKGKQPEPELMLRKPHLDKVRADVAAAEAALEKAALDLKRSLIQAPFNAIVRSKSVDVGSQVSPQDPLAELVGTDAYWVQASVPVDRLDWIRIPQQSDKTGSSARIHYARDHVVEGKVKRLMGDLASEGRMARILVEVQDPLRRRAGSGNGPPLLIGEYVRVEIKGRQLDNVFAVPRNALRDDGKIWLVKQDKTLDIIDVTAVWRGADTVLLRDGLKAGDKIVVSDLSAPVPGMQLRLDQDESQARIKRRISGPKKDQNDAPRK
jgi:RND family efflux transporter MFP subunit